MKNKLVQFCRYPTQNEPIWRLVIPKRMKHAILHLYHDRYIHMGTNRMIREIGKLYYWYKYTDDIKDFVANCKICQQSKYSKSTQHKAKFTFFQPLDVGEIIAIDFVGPFAAENKYGYHSILTIIDLFDGWVTYIPTLDQRADSWILALEKYFWEHNTPTTILCDNGTSFRSKVAQRFKELCGLNIRFAAPYNPQCNGKCERANRFLKDSLRHIGIHYQVNEPEINLKWFNFTNYIALIHNTCISPSTGFAPWTIRKLQKPPDPLTYNWSLYGELISETNAPISKTIAPSKAKLNELIIKKAKKNIVQFTQKKYEQYLKINKDKPELNIKVGDKVMVREDRWKNKTKTTQAKLAPKWLGPFTVLRKNPSNTSFEVTKLQPGVQNRTFWANFRRIRIHPSSRGVEARLLE